MAPAGHLIASVWPSTNSVTMYNWPSNSSRAYTVQMPGCVRMAAAEPRGAAAPDAPDRAELRGERLDRTVRPSLASPAQIHPPHAASAKLAHDRVGADRRAGRKRLLFFEQMRRRFHQRLREKRTRAGMVIEQRSHFQPNLGIGLRRFQPATHVRGMAIERGFEEIAGPAMLLGSHVLSSRKSQARARLQRRFSVAGDIPIASAASSTLMPRNSEAPQSWPARRRSARRRSIASSTQATSSPIGGKLHESVIDTAVERSPSLLGASARPRSTRIWRMDRAAMPTK